MMGVYLYIVYCRKLQRSRLYLIRVPQTVIPAIIGLYIGFAATFEDD